MKTTPTTTKPVRERPLAGYGRDELNIAEFPITLLTDEAPEGVKTLTFSDQIIDRGEIINRTVTITGSDEYGLPTPFDMDVLLCLIQLTKAKNDFTEPQVFFNRGDILKLLGLVDCGKNYKRLDKAIRRWLAVTLYYDRSWWKKDENKWSTPHQKGFHILEDISLIDRETKQREKSQSQIELFQSSITWNRVFFQSCQAENLKFLDMDIYFSLQRAISRQMYRFLDKRFYRGSIWSFDLRQFAFNHIGISKNYTTGKIKEKLQPALEELEGIGFLEPCSRENRYQKEGKEWKIRLVHNVKHADNQPKPEETATLSTALPPSPLLAELISRGVTGKTAADLVKRHQAEAIAAKIEEFDFLASKQDKKVSKSPAGYLVKSIDDNYAPPKGYNSKAELERQAEAKRQADQTAAEERRRKQQEAARDRRLADQVKTYRQSQTPEQLAQLEADAIAAASEESRRNLNDPALKPFRKTLVSGLLNDHIARLLQAEAKQEEPA